MRSNSVLVPVCVGLVVIIVGCNDTPDAGGMGRSGSDEKRESAYGTIADGGRSANPTRVKNGSGDELMVTVERLRYLADCKMLFIHVFYRNESERPLFVVANDFNYVDFGAGAPGHRLVAQYDGKELTLDLSHVMPTQLGLEYFRGEEGSFGPLDDCIEIPAGHLRNVTYTFQFPLEMDRRMSEFVTCEAPRGVTKVRLRFGYSHEDSWTFVAREMGGAQSVEDWQERVVEEWQSIAETTPKEIDFSHFNDAE